MTDNPDWTGRQALTAAPIQLNGGASLALAGVNVGNVAFGVVVPAGRRVRVFAVEAESGVSRLQHFVALTFQSVTTQVFIAGLFLGPNEPTKMRQLSPPFDAPVGEDIQCIGRIVSGVAGDAETMPLTILYAVVG